ncbi:glycosyltransferase family 4 protein [Marinobacter nauticus]|uniref:Phosphatidylinositol alpha-1,6-mannosyltransferase n=1 Tax=Marinobacter nauticus TaxID=2743 RepID=A0A368V010_MARNT|nr:glycosyltransferase family 4 protein [Marinobacter nauticus]RBP72693.1 phosphatidylinositol alpha-1,6-mannosyltransferase [Marinobacter nauticus]RCW33620.1 phosphatidylinositol alpha-1,6-mannosyltransferase [Marinobacter nauticus]
MINHALTGPVLLVTRNFPPLIGGMEKLNFHLAKELAKSSPVHVVGPAGSSRYSNEHLKVTSCPTSIYFYLPVSALFIASLAIKSLISDKTKRHRLVIAGSGVTALIAWLFARMTRCQFGVYLHGLDIIVDNMVYRRIFLPAIKKADFWIVNSSATREKAIEAGIPKSGISIIHPGVDLPDRSPSSIEAQRWRAAHNLSESPILISVGRLTKRKGLKEFILYSLPKIVQSNPNAQLLVIGGEPKNALQKNSVGCEALKNAAIAAGVQNNLRFMGSVSDKVLSMIYSCANIHIFPIIATPGDMEGFGMVALESAARGVPTVAFAEGGVVDAVQNGTSGYLIKPGDYDGFAKAVNDLIYNPGKIRPDDARSFAANFAWTLFGDRVRKLTQTVKDRNGRATQADS